MILANPVPYGAPNNSPLDVSGSDFPCKAVPYTVNTMNNWEVGSQQSISFTGTAVHGGGSCQVSVTADKEPTKESKWKVIYSIEGGCPAAAEGNLDQNGPSLDGTFPFTVPSELPNGEMTVAWTWFNKIGNREMYMNCAPITVSGGSDDKGAFEALPDMATANIGGDSCTTTEGSDYTFENPGKYKISAGKGPFVDLCSGASSTPGGGGGGADTGSPAPPPPGAPVSSQPPVSPSSAAMETTLRTIKTVTAPMPPVPATSNVDGAPAPGASGKPCKPAPQPSAGPTPPTGIENPVAPVAPAPSPDPARPIPPVAPAPSAAPAPSSGPGPSTGSGTSCSADGAIICSEDGTQFGICNFGKAVMMPVASGTKCSNGAIAKRGDYSHRNQRTAV
jgi:hypothetical protein